VYAHSVGNTNGTDDGTASAVLRSTRRPPIGLITDRDVPSSFSITAVVAYVHWRVVSGYTQVRTNTGDIEPLTNNARQLTHFSALTDCV